MNHWSRLARRLSVTVGSAFVVASAAFLLAAVTPNGRETIDEPLPTAYREFLVDLVTLDWGYSAVGGGPVVDALARAIPNTLDYLLPAVAVAVLVGVGTGILAALRPRGYLDRTASTLAYVGYALPNFLLGSMLVLLFALDPLRGVPVYDNSAVQKVVWPAALMATTLLAAQFRYARAHAREYADTEFVQLLRAKGGGTRTLGRHVLRNAALPLASLFFVETYAILFVEALVVESVFQIRGVGYLGMLAAWQTDVPMVLGVTLLFAFVGMGGNLLQDLAAGVLDPRVDDDLHGIVADLRRWVGEAGDGVASALPNPAVVLLADPDQFFRDRRPTGFRGGGWVVLAAAVVAVIPTVLYRNAVGSATAGPVVGAGLGPVLGTLTAVLSPAGRVLVTWLAAAAVLHAVARLVGGRASPVETLRATAWGWTPVLLFGLVSAAATAVVLVTVPTPDSVGVGRFAFAVSGHPLAVTVGRLGVVATAWQGFLWLFGVRHAHDLSLRDAVAVAAVPTVAVLAWHAGVALWGTPAFVREVPLLPWLLGGGVP